MELNLLQKAGEISDLERQKKLPLKVNDVLICNYYGDFYFNEKGLWVCEDTKGEWTDVFRIKLALVKALYAGQFEMRVT